MTTTITYDYDPLYRLTAATYSTGEVYTYTYDEVGNRLAKGVDGEVTAYAYDAANRLTNAGGVEYTWDGNGNLLDDGLRTYGYDHANRLVQVVSGTFTTTFSYNGDGDRVAKSENAVTTSYVVAILGLSQVLVETTGGQSTWYVYGHDLLAESDGEAWAYHLNDGLGSVRQLADESGTIVLVQSYTPFGVPLASQGSGATGYGFTGERWEAYSALLFLRARYYEPASGRFLSKDPWSGDLQYPLTLQGWVYVRNNPTNAIDPSGWYDYNKVHYGLTRQWAFEIASGFAPMLDPERIAEAIAAGDRRTDTNLRLSSVSPAPCIPCHFCSPERTRAHINDAINSCNPYFFGHILHQAQDFYSHWNEGYHWEHVSHTQTNRPQDKLDDFFLGGHYEQIADPGAETGVYEVWVESPYPAHPREQVEYELRVRNLGLVVNGKSKDDLIDLYLRDEPGTDPEFWEKRDYFKFNTDKYVEGSRRDIVMELQSRRYILRFMMHLVVGCCQIDWEDAVIQDAYEALTR